MGQRETPRAEEPLGAVSALWLGSGEGQWGFYLGREGKLYKGGGVGAGLCR